MLDKLSEWPSQKGTKYLLIFSIVLLCIIYPFMGYYFLLSENPGDVTASQLSFSGEYMKAYYAAIGNIDLYRIAETLDYGFMVSYCCLIVSLALIIARKFEEDSPIRKSGYFMVLFGIIAAGLDAVENGFILAMLTDPSGFPNLWAIAHSTFALIKWILLIIIILWALCAIIIKVIKR